MIPGEIRKEVEPYLRLEDMLEDMWTLLQRIDMAYATDEQAAAWDRLKAYFIDKNFSASVE